MTDLAKFAQHNRLICGHLIDQAALLDVDDEYPDARRKLDEMLVLNAAIDSIVPDAAAEPDPGPTPDPDPSPGRQAIIDGAGVKTANLQKVGSITTTKDGQVIEHMECGNIVVKHANVVIRNVRQHVTARYGIDASLPAAKNLLVEDIDFYATTAKDQGGPSTLIYARSGVTIRRALLVTAGNDCLKVNDSTLDISGSYLIASKPDGSLNHSDGIQVRKATGVKIHGNVIHAPHTDGGNAAAIVQAAEGNIDNVLVEGNYLSGGNHTLFTTEKGYQITNVRILRNVFSRVNRYGIHLGRFDEWADNRWEDGELIPAPS